MLSQLERFRREGRPAIERICFFASAHEDGGDDDSYNGFDEIQDLYALLN